MASLTDIFIDNSELRKRRNKGRQLAEERYDPSVYNPQADYYRERATEGIPEGTEQARRSGAIQNLFRTKDYSLYGGNQAAAIAGNQAQSQQAQQAYSDFEQNLTQQDIQAREQAAGQYAQVSSQQKQTQARQDAAKEQVDLQYQNELQRRRDKVRSAAIQTVGTIATTPFGGGPLGMGASSLVERGLSSVFGGDEEDGGTDERMGNLLDLTDPLTTNQKQETGIGEQPNNRRSAVGLSGQGLSSYDNNYIDESGVFSMEDLNFGEEMGIEGGGQTAQSQQSQGTTDGGEQTTQPSRDQLMDDLDFEQDTFEGFSGTGEAQTSGVEGTYNTEDSVRARLLNNRQRIEELNQKDQQTGLNETEFRQLFRLRQENYELSQNEPLGVLPQPSAGDRRIMEGIGQAVDEIGYWLNPTLDERVERKFGN